MFSVLVAVLAVVCLAVTAHAVSITHNGSSIFQSGGFEADVVDALPTSAAQGVWVHRSGDALKESVLGPASTGPGAAVDS